MKSAPPRSTACARSYASSVTNARYDAVADFYEAGWTDSYDDPATAALFALLGPVAELRVLDVACGHGRITRELARRGARVTAVDVSDALLEKARVVEAREPLGIEYVHADISSSPRLSGPFDAATCSFGLSDIDDLDGAISSVARALAPGGRFVCSLLHPCFAGAGEVSGSWPARSKYSDERWWTAEGARSTLRRAVGANHRMLSTYVNTFREHGFGLDAMAEPPPPSDWAEQAPEAARFPVFLVVRCVRRPNP